MPKRFYEPKSASTELNLWIDPTLYSETEDIANLADFNALLACDDFVRQQLADLNGYPTLETYDVFIQDQADEIEDRLDYYNYSTRLEELTVADGAWFSPDAIQSVGAEDLGNEASRAVDGNNATFWRDSTNHQHVIIFDLRSYPKKIAKIRFRYGAGESARERLNNMDVHASRGIANIDDAGNILETGINIAWPTPGDVWVEHTLAQKKNKARFIKLVIDDTDNGSNHAQIREFEVWVETRDP